MKVNIIIKIQATDDDEQSVETKFNDCDPDAVLAKDSLKLLHPIIKTYVETFDGEVA
jgi:hypothetical protein